MKIDSHQHFWHYDPGFYPWMDGEEKTVLRRNYLPEDLAREQELVKFDGSIAVQARQSLEESRWLLKLTNGNDRIKGVVGWVDLRSDKVADQLAEFAAHPKFVGVRHVVQDEPDDTFMLLPAFTRGIEKLRQFGLVYDILIYPRQLPAAIELVRRFPEQPFVLDHLAKPLIKKGVLSSWSEQIRELAKHPNVCCKVSGMVTEADWKAWKKEHLWPYMDVVLQAFGDDRLMVGSDWPVCLLAGSYEKVINVTLEFFQQLDAAGQERVFGGNASRCYLNKPTAASKRG